MANKFVKDPHEMVKPGQIIKVKVLEIDEKRQRISLTMRLDDAAGVAPRSNEARADSARGPREAKRDSPPGGAIALALERAKRKK